MTITWSIIASDSESKTSFGVNSAIVLFVLTVIYVENKLTYKNLQNLYVYVSSFIHWVQLVIK